MTPGEKSTAYPITNIRAIGSDTAAILRLEGIRTTIGLLRSAKSPKQRLKIAEKTGVNKTRVLDWVTAADRMRINGVGWEYAELLRAVGVKTVNELKYRNPEKLAQAMSEANGKRGLVRLVPSVSTVVRWIESARKLPSVIRY
jgi:hypothetical protein